MKIIIWIFSLFLIATASYASDVSITIDDFHLDGGPLLGPETKDKRILAALKKHGIQAALFVAAKNLSETPASNKRLSYWDRAGHIIANHTFSHSNCNTTDFGVYTRDILKAERLLSGYTNFQKLFRFPMLKEGETAEKRDLVRAFLAEHGYKNGYVTIDASDWYLNSRLIEKLEQDSEADLKPYRDFYLKHIWERSQFYDDLAMKVLGHEVKHTLLTHHNLLNALFLDDLIKMYASKGWRVINASETFSDPIYNEKPQIVPAGESLIWALAKQTGEFENILRYPGESEEYEKPEMDRLGL